MSDRPESSRKGATSSPKELRWRYDLLSSSIQLEYRVAKAITRRGYDARSEYAYERHQAGAVKEMSADILGRRTYRIEDKDVSAEATIDLIIECKYRRPEIAWLFVPQIEKPSGMPVRASTIRIIDDFSNFAAHSGADIQLPRCYKGIEIDLSSKDNVDDQRMRHGLEQLQHALIHLLRSYVIDSIVSLQYEPEFAGPYAVMPILVTNAPLFVATKSFDNVDLTSITTLEEFATRTRALSVDFRPGPHFRGELRRAFSDPELSDHWSKAGMLFERVGVLRNAGSPWVYYSLQNGFTNTLDLWFSQIVVCEADALESLVVDHDLIVDSRFRNLEPLTMDLT